MLLLPRVLENNHVEMALALRSSCYWCGLSLDLLCYGLFWSQGSTLQTAHYRSQEGDLSVFLIVTKIFHSQLLSRPQK